MKKLILVITMTLLFTAITNGQSLAYKLATIESVEMDYPAFSGKSLYDLEDDFSSLLLRLDQYYTISKGRIGDYTAHTQGKLKNYGIKASMLKIMKTAMIVEYNKINYEIFCAYYYTLRKRGFTSNQIAFKINMQL